MKEEKINAEEMKCTKCVGEIRKVNGRGRKGKNRKRNEDKCQTFC